jgi:prolyl oligopeptidase
VVACAVLRSFDFALLCGVLACAGACDPATPAVKPPEPATGATPAGGPVARAVDSLASTRREDVADTLHGVRVADPYRWLERAEEPAVKAWMQARDGEAREALLALPRREALARRFRELYYIDSISPPYREGKRYFYSRRHADKEKRVHYYREGAKGPEQVLLDPNTMSTDGSVSLSGISISQDGRYVAYSLSHNNSDDAVLHVKDLDTGKELPTDTIPGARYAYPQWLPDSSGFYYTGLPVDPAIPAEVLPGKQEVRFHRLGADPRTDEVVHPALEDPTKFLGVSLSRDGRWLMIHVTWGTLRNEVFFRDRKAKPVKVTGADKPARPSIGHGFTPLIYGVDAHYYAEAYKNRFYVTSDEGAPNGRVFVAEPGRPGRDQWKEILAERKDAVLEGASVVGGHLSVAYLKDVASRAEVHRLDGSLVREVALPGIGSASAPGGREDEDEAYYFYNSFTEMPQIFRTSIKTGKTELWDTIKYKADTSAMTVQQVKVRSKDGTQVPMFVVHRKDLKMNGDNPTLLTGYGGFGASMSPSFSTRAVVWLEQGGVMAIPGLRGGGEYGESWHKAGMRGGKQRVFDDFIAAAEYLVAEKYTRPERLAISGGSNGGLLVGAAMVQRPELFRAVICDVPLLDMVRYHKFGAGATWIEEYGSADVPADFAYIHAYSPYHHIREGARYPALLMMSADSDDRVDPLHARKFAAGVAWATRSGRPVLLRIEQNAGHGGADLVKSEVESSADEFAFLLAQLGDPVVADAKK